MIVKPSGHIGKKGGGYRRGSEKLTKTIKTLGNGAEEKKKEDSETDHRETPKRGGKTNDFSRQNKGPS